MLRATAGTIAGAAGPYLVYLVAEHGYGLQSSLRNLNVQGLLACAIGCALASPLLHHIWFMLQQQGDLAAGFFVMFVGDLAGSVIVLYAAKAIIGLRDRQARGAWPP